MQTQNRRIKKILSEYFFRKGLHGVLASWHGNIPNRAPQYVERDQRNERGIRVSLRTPYCICILQYELLLSLRDSLTLALTLIST